MLVCSGVQYSSPKVIACLFVYQSPYHLWKPLSERAYVYLLLTALPVSCICFVVFFRLVDKSPQRNLLPGDNSAAKIPALPPPYVPDRGWFVCCVVWRYFSRSVRY